MGDSFRWRVRTAAVAIAAERCRLKHDCWPNAMKELIHEGLLKEEYTDPYDGKRMISLASLTHLCDQARRFDPCE